MDPTEELLGWAGRHLDHLADEAEAAIAAAMPDYVAAVRPGTAGLRAALEQNLPALLDRIGGGAGEIEAAAETGRIRARQGVPLAEVLRVYRLTFLSLWQSLSLEASVRFGADGAKVMQEISRSLWVAIDEHASALTEAYRATDIAMLRAQGLERGAIVDALISGHRAGPAARDPLAQLAFPPGAPLAVIVAHANAVRPSAVPKLEDALEAAGIGSAWRPTPALQIGLVALGDEGEAPLLAALREATDAAVGVSPVFHGADGVPRAYRLARQALAGGTDGGVQVFSDDPIAALVADSPSEARRVAEQVLGGLDQLAAEEREVLVQTLRAYFDTGGSMAAAGRALHCHPNTVRNRLHKLEAATGTSLERPADVAALGVALAATKLDA